MKHILPQFSNWVLWSERERLGQALGKPGVYVVKRSVSDASRRRLSIKEQLLYIGETCSQTLRGRLHQFNRSAFSGKASHSGGQTFFSHFNITEPPAWLAVAILPVTYEEPKLSAYIRYVERVLLWEYLCVHKVLPPCNRK